MQGLPMADEDRDPAALASQAGSAASDKPLQRDAPQRDAPPHPRLPLAYRPRQRVDDL